ncbi:hypothetical protein [Phyllobacterium endophyticum]|uniref:Uncharacterized protein n=1 Tax=Phyllobacterium endophyticum TaxID=1149773 RepID=A0A2P7AYM4_9HYPH|nr:hypothetical protein [Phyllobacterium endophyticum]MBB3236142.1 hypothetical protein [Phyllobacterium endophyticum]PSH59307.1 hypothetical protein CU100_00420 [Phyllobacterium endophyticum]TYR41431.1 hypothetical protein FY050_09070 [Phyllobacterium endophyticum]
MKVYIANFGRENYAWPDCLARNTIATMNDISVQGFWEAGDRESYIQNRMKHDKTAAGITPTRPVASRWFNLMTTIVESSGDVWIHREKNQLWWTISRQDAPSFEPLKETFGVGRNVIICHKPCDPWAHVNRAGNKLDWTGLHSRAKEFMFTEGTLQQLRPANAEYALALINGDDLSPWHSLQEWKANAERKKKNPAITFNARQNSIAYMAMMAKGIVATSNGQEVLKTVKNKELRIPDRELEPYLSALLDAQEGLCAITGLQLQHHGYEDDKELLCSLDRIDSDGHYEFDNLQIVCRFVNRWKSNGKDTEFRRLVALLRE